MADAIKIGDTVSKLSATYGSLPRERIHSRLQQPGEIEIYRGEADQRSYSLRTEGRVGSAKSPICKPGRGRKLRKVATSAMGVLVHSISSSCGMSYPPNH